MKWFVHVFAGKTAVHGPFASLDGAMRWHREHCFRSRGRVNHGWWYHPQMDEASGEINFISFQIPSRQMTDEEMIACSCGNKRILAGWRRFARAKLGPNITDHAAAAANAEFILPGLEAVHFSREDRMRGEVRSAIAEGNDRSADIAALAGELTCV